MALIINNKELVDSHEYIELNLNSRTFSSLNNYVVSVAGDNNSQKLTFKFKNQYDNIPLIGTACLLIYYTDWLDDDDPPKPSSGIVNLPMVENEEEGYITAEWVLNKNQTYRDGNCNFGIMFYLPTDEEFYFATDENGNLINNIETIIPQYDNGKVMILEQDELKEYEYYSLNTLTSSFTIVPSALSNQENFNAGTVYDDLVMKVDSKLDPESKNPVENRVLYDLFTVKNQKVNKYGGSITIADALPSSPIEIKIEQNYFPEIAVGDNKFLTKILPTDYFNSNGGDISVDIPSGKKAVFSFRLTNNVSIGSVTFLAVEAMGPDYIYSPEIATVEIKSKSIPDYGERHYIEIDNTSGYTIDTLSINFDWSTPPSFDDCALRFVDEGETFDDNIEYIECEKEELKYDLTKLSVHATNPEQDMPVNADGTVDRIIFSEDGSPRIFSLIKYSNENHLTWTFKYRRSIAAEIADLKSRLTNPATIEEVI